MLAASLLDRTESLTAPNIREALTAAEPKPKVEPRTQAQLAAAKRGAQKSLLRTYLKHRVVIETGVLSSFITPDAGFLGRNHR